MRTVFKNSKSSMSAGQAMVEFLFILTLLMTMCAGMLYISRLLTFDFWARQEARYIAFEQTTHPHSYYALPLTEPVLKTADGNYFRRPKLVSTLDSTKSATDDGSLIDLIPVTGAIDPIADDPRKIREIPDGDSPLMFAQSNLGSNSGSSSIWTERTGDWMNRWKSKLSILDTAFASQGLMGDPDPDGSLQNTPYNDDTVWIPSGYPSTKIERGFVKILNKTDFGIKLCETMNDELRRAGKRMELFSDSSCPQRLENSFGIHLARTTDFKSFFLDYGDRIDWGQTPADALETTAKVEIARGFYSWFDTTVKNSVGNAPNEFNSFALDVDLELASDDEFQALITSMRYMGSIVAIGAVATYSGLISAESSTNRQWAVEKSFEDDANDILLADAEDALGIGFVGNGFNLGPEYLPIPLTLVPLAPAMFDGMMKNVLGQDTGMWDSQIDNANKFVSVSYDSTKGVFSGAKKRFNTGSRVLSAKFYLVTEPWHIPRRESPLGPFRELGDENDSMDDSSDEGILRRRTFGLFFIPSQPGQFLAPFLGLVGGLDAAEGVLDAVGGIVTFVKNLIFNNPLIDIVNTINDLPGVGELIGDFSLPYFPAVRPVSYPRSVEMKEDKKMGEEREFKDYIEEQKKLNSEPNPDYREEDD